MDDRYYRLAAYSHNKKFYTNHHIDFYDFVDVYDNNFQAHLHVLLLQYNPLPSEPFCGKNHHLLKLQFS